MKIKKAVSLFLLMILIISFAISSIPVYAHDTILDVQYDNCIANDGISSSSDIDGIYEMWYVLSNNTMSYHISDEESTIGYAFTDNPDTGESWDDVAEANEIKEAYANSMKKWNNVYFYSYDSSGIITKKKIINVVEITDGNHILSIYPGVVNSDLVAETVAVEGYGTSQHSHYHKWKMGINISYFSTTGPFNIEVVNFLRERTGAHELGHVLGLFDVDFQFDDGTRLCNSTNSSDHHCELLMGYGSPLTSRSQNITYKDIAGVAITRGFHTDDDHKWLNAGLQDDDTYKLICSVCNGVKYDADISGYLYNSYGACNNVHDVSSGNMMAVASYGTADYYKCKYCRYVAPFTSNVDQSYTKANYSSSQHKCTNTVEGLEYSFFENHIFSYIGYSSTQHRKRCGCGYSTLLYHVILDSSATIKTCIYCKAIVESGGGAIVGMALGNISYITENGSYIRPDGVIVISDIDYELLMNGELDIYALACDHDAE